MSEPTSARTLSGMTPAEADAYLLKRLRDLENLVVQLGCELEQARSDIASHQHMADYIIGGDLPPNPYKELRPDALG